jgi:hypothetical protein
VDALQLMEFNLRFEKLQKGHRRCVSTLRKFWRVMGDRQARDSRSGAAYLASKVARPFLRRVVLL